MKINSILFLLMMSIMASYGQDFKFPVVIGYTDAPGELLKTTEILELHKYIQYLGEYKDTITFSMKTRQDRESGLCANGVQMRDWEPYPPVDFNYVHHIRKFNGYTIVVDTTQIITLPYSKGYDLQGSTAYPYVNYQAHPICISYEKDSAVFLGEMCDLPLSLFALNQAGKWTQIEEGYRLECGVGMGNKKEPVLMPNQIVCVLAPIYAGDRRVKLRYKLWRSYSNEFWGYIPSELLKE